MRMTILFGAALAAMTFTLSAAAVEDQGIPDDMIGLSKGSLDDSPEPAVFEYGGKEAGSVGVRSVRSYNTAPPMIPHSTRDMTPITLESNLCKDCHVQPEQIGKKIAKGMAVPTPASHYADVKAGQLSMRRWNCTQCHREQANVKLLVESTFGKKTRK